MENQQYSALVVSVQQNVKSGTGNYGAWYIHKVLVRYSNNNEEEGSYMSKDAICKYFVPGQNATFTREVKMVGQYTNINFKPVSDNKGGFGNKGGYKNYTPDKSVAILAHKVSLTVAASNAAITLVAAGDLIEGKSIEESVAIKTESILKTLVKVSGLQNAIDAYAASKTTEAATTNAAQQVQQPVQQPVQNLPPQNFPTQNSPSSPAPINNGIPPDMHNAAASMPTDDLPF